MMITERVWETYCEELFVGLSQVQAQNIDAIAEVLISAAKNRLPTFVAGNGASAALSQHWACDHLKGSSSTTYSNRVISLASNMATVTAIGNDFGYENIFTTQFRHLTDSESKGVVVLISARGNSKNIIDLARYVRSARKQMTLIGLTGFDGGGLKELCHVNVHVPVNDYGVVEDAHNAVMHVLAKILRTNLAQ